MTPYILFTISGITAAAITARKLKIKTAKPNGVLLFTAFIGMILGAKGLIWLTFGLNSTTLIYGKSLLGGIIGAFIAINLYKLVTRQKNTFGDGFAIPLAVGAGFGKIGCFFNGCCGGKPWGFLGVEHYPTQLMESSFNFIMAFILYRLYKSGKAEGILFPVYFLSYMFMRFFIEFLRTEPHAAAGLTAFQIASLVFIPLFAYIIYRRKFANAK